MLLIKLLISTVIVYLSGATPTLSCPDGFLLVNGNCVRITTSVVRPTDSDKFSFELSDSDDDDTAPRFFMPFHHFLREKEQRRRRPYDDGFDLMGAINHFKNNLLNSIFSETMKPLQEMSQQMSEIHLPPIPAQNTQVQTVNIGKSPSRISSISHETHTFPDFSQISSFESENVPSITIFSSPDDIVDEDDFPFNMGMIPMLINSFITPTSSYQSLHQSLNQDGSGISIMSTALHDQPKIPTDDIDARSSSIVEVSTSKTAGENSSSREPEDAIKELICNLALFKPICEAKNKMDEQGSRGEQGVTVEAEKSPEAASSPTAEEAASSSPAEEAPRSTPAEEAASSPPAEEAATLSNSLNQIASLTSKCKYFDEKGNCIENDNKVEHAPTEKPGEKETIKEKSKEQTKSEIKEAMTKAKNLGRNKEEEKQVV